jgi:hypothetical protein
MIFDIRSKVNFFTKKFTESFASQDKDGLLGVLGSVPKGGTCAESADDDSERKEFWSSGRKALNLAVHDMLSSTGRTLLHHRAEVDERCAMGGDGG